MKNSNLSAGQEFVSLLVAVLLMLIIIVPLAWFIVWVLGHWMP